MSLEELYVSISLCSNFKGERQAFSASIGRLQEESSQIFKPPHRLKESWSYSSSASTSTIVRFIFWTDTAMPALRDTRLAT